MKKGIGNISFGETEKSLLRHLGLPVVESQTESPVFQLSCPWSQCLESQCVDILGLPTLERIAKEPINGSHLLPLPTLRNKGVTLHISQPGQ